MDFASPLEGRGNGPATGDFTLTVFGSNFGAYNLNAKASIDGSECVTTTWKSDSSVQCRIREGLGKDLSVSLQVEDSAVQRASTVTKSFSYDVAHVKSWIFFEWAPTYPYNHPATTGGNSISVLGSNFGTTTYSDKTRLGDTTAEATIWISDSTIRVRVAEGIGAELYLGITTLSGVGEVDAGFSYGRPVISGRTLGLAPLFSPANGPVAGNSTTTIFGFNFGTTDYSGKASLGGTAINEVLTNWQSDTMIAIRTPPGACDGTEVSFTVARQIDTHTKAWSYDAPEISAAPKAAVNGSAINSPTTGGKTVTVLGINFGVWRLSGNGKYGETSGEASKWTSDSSVSFKSPSGIGKGLTAAFSVCGRFGEVKNQLSYDAPIVTDQTPSNGRTAGGSSITLFGANFGSVDFTGRASVGTHTNKTLVYLDGAGNLVPYNTTGATTCEATSWFSETSARCKVSAGAGVEYGVAFTVAHNIGTQQSGHFFSYDKPVMTSAYPSNGPAYGGENVTLVYGGELTTYSITMLGRDFGKVDYTPKARLGDTDCMAAKWLSSSSIVCKIPGGGCTGVSIAVSVLGYNNGTQYGVATKQFSYDAPSLSSIDVGNNTGPTSGGTDFRINGKNFGAGHHSIAYRIGSTVMNQTTWISDTFVMGKVPAGVCKELTLGITVCDSEGTLSGVFSYYTPNVTGTSGGEVNQMSFKGARTGAALDPAPSVPLVLQTGGSTVSVTGAYFGHADYSARVRFASTAGTSTNWTSDTAVQAVNPSGVCADHHIVTTVCDQTGTKEGAFCYDIPFVTAGTNRWPNRPTTGSQTISLLGVNFGTAQYSPAGRVMWTELKSEWTSGSSDTPSKNYTGTACMGTGWISFSSVSCKYPAGIYPDHVVRFTICGQGTNNNETTFSYDEPKILNLRYGNSPATGQVSMHVTGFNFGTADYSAKMYVGHTERIVHVPANASQTAFTATDWESDTSLFTKTPPGLGLELGVILFHNVTGRPAGTLKGLFSYDGPTISSVALGNGPASGALNITITGANYGVEDYFTFKNIKGMLRAGGTASDSSYWLSDSSMLGLVSPGVCPYKPLVVSVMTQVGTASEVFSYNKPVIYWNDTSQMFSGPLVDNGDGVSFTPNAPAASNQNATISGYHFGANDYTVKARIGATSLLLMKWSSDTAVVGMVAPGVCHSHNTSMVVCDQVGTSSMVFSYNAPIVVMNGTNAPTTGKQILMLNGLNYGNNDYSAAVSMGFTDGEATFWTSDTVVHVQIAAGIYNSLVMTSTVCEQVGTQQDTYSYFSYDGPATSSMNGNGPATGGKTVTVAGSDFGTAGYTGRARIGNGNANNTVFGATSAEATGWKSDTAITGKLPAGVSHLLGVTFTIGLQIGTSSAHFTFDVPKPTAARSANSPGSGAASTTISGSNFGIADYSGTSAFGDTSAETSVWQSTTAIIAKVAAGVCHGLDIVVTVGDTVLDAKAQATAQIGAIIDHRAYSTRESLFSYDAPAVTSTFRYEVATSGGETMTVRGSSFAKWGSSAQARLGHSAAEAMKWTSDSEMTLKVPAGCGKEKTVVVTSCLQVGSLSQAVSYKPPMVSSAATPNQATVGGYQFVTVAGSSFVAYDTTARAAVGFTAAVQTEWQSETSIRTSPSAGACSGHDVIVTVCNQMGTLSLALSYDRPAFVDLSGTNSPKKGGSTSTVSGSNFATSDVSGAFRFESAAEATLWKSDTSLMAKSHAGHDGMLKIVFTACHSMRTWTGAFTFDSPVITKGGPTNGPTVGAVLTSYGVNFAAADYSAKTRIGGTAVAATVWISDSSAASNVPAGVGGSHDVVFSIATQFNTLTNTFTFDNPTITTVRGTNGVATGGTEISIYGLNFGTWDDSATARVGDSACTQTRWVSDSHMICKAPAGVCDKHKVSIGYVNGKSGTLPHVFSYDDPALTVASWANGPASGGNDVTVIGFNFGTAAYSQRVLVSGGGYVMPAQATTWVADNRLMAKMPAGGGIDMDLTAEVCELRSTLADAYCYDVPSVSAINSKSANMWDPKFLGNAPQTGGTTTTIFGQNFGTFDLSVESTIGGTNTLMTRWMSDSSLLVKVPPGAEAGVAVDVFLEAAGHKLESLTVAFSFDAPVIDAVSPANAEAQSTITISGSNMGPWDTSPTAKVGGTVCEAVAWASWSSILCKTPAGVGGQHDVEVALAGHEASQVDALTYAPPLVTAALLPNGPLSGGTTVTVFGAGFGGWNVNPDAKFGDTACITTTWVSATSLTCALSAGIGRAAVTVEGSSSGTAYSGSKSDAFFYDSPQPTAVLRGNAPGTGGTTLSITGLNFGSYVDPNPANALKGMVGVTACATTTWTSDTSATCVAPEGIGIASVSMDLAGAVGRLERAIIYDGFYVESMSPRNSPTAGGSSVIVTGHMLGTSSNPPTVMFGASAGTVQWTSPTSLNVVIPAHIKEWLGTDVTVTVDRPQTLPNYFSYDGAIITSVKPTRGERAGGNIVTVKGSNFGNVATPFTIMIGDANCTEVTYISDEQCTCKAPRSASYSTVSVSYAHASVSWLSAEDQAAYPDYVYNLSDAYQYKVYTGPKAIGVPVSTVVEAGAAATLELSGGTKLDMPAGAFSVPVDVTVAAVSPFDGAEPAVGNSFASDLLVFNTADADGNYVAPTAPIAVAIPVNLRRSMLKDLSERASSGQISRVSLRESADALLQNLSESAPPSKRRLLQANTNLRGAWLDKCTGAWNAICSTSYNEATKSVEGDIPPSVFSDTCFNPSSGCTQAIVAAEQCEGEGGTLTAMAFTEDPCDDDSSSSDDDQNVALIVGLVLGAVLLLLIVGVALWRMKTSREDDDDESYASSKSYSDDEEIGSQYTSQAGSYAGSYPPSPRLQIMPASGMYGLPGGSPGYLPGGSPAMPGSGMFLAPPGSYLPPSQYDQIGSAQPMDQGDPLQYMGSQYGDMQGGMYGNAMYGAGYGADMYNSNVGGMGLPPPVFSQGMGIGAMAGGSPQGYYSGYRAQSRAEERQM